MNIYTEREAGVGTDHKDTETSSKPLEGGTCELVDMTCIACKVFEQGSFIDSEMLGLYAERRMS